LEFGIYLEFGAWNLEYIWNLVLGIWDLFGFWCSGFDKSRRDERK
jgi:hypothetical protein